MSTSIPSFIYKSFGAYSIGSTLLKYAASYAAKEGCETTKSPYYLQSHIDKKCKMLGLKSIPFYTTTEHTRRISINELPGARSFIFINRDGFLTDSPCSEKYDKEAIKGLTNHELGHAYHRHLTKEAITSIALGALCFFPQTRLVSTVALLGSKVLSAPIDRFQEKQADAICATISTKNELKGVIRILKKDKAPAPPSLLSKTITFFTNPTLNNLLSKTIIFFTKPHPPIEERISFFEEALKAKRLNSLTSLKQDT